VFSDTDALAARAHASDALEPDAISVELMRLKAVLLYVDSTHIVVNMNEMPLARFSLRIVDTFSDCCATVRLNVFVPTVVRFRSHTSARFVPAAALGSVPSCAATSDVSRGLPHAAPPIRMRSVSGGISADLSAKLLPKNVISPPFASAGAGFM
jgi:hypothetical protein